LRLLKQIAVIAAVLQILPVIANAEPKSDRVTWRAGLKTRAELWIIRRDVWGDSYYFGWHSDQMVDTFHPQAHLMYKPEITINYQKFYLRTSASISSNTSLKQKLEGYPDEPATVSNSGTGKWSGVDADLGYGGIASGYLGVRYRRISITSWPNDSLFSHTIVDPVIGMRLYSTKFANHENMITNLEMFMGLSLLTHIFDEEESVQHTAMAGISLDMGWRPNGGNLEFTAGYGVELFTKYIGKSSPSSKHWQNMTNFMHGVSLTLSWAP
jgi:hypothetical protein